MKNNILVTAFALLLTVACFGQKPFEGTITYSIEFEGLPEQAQSLMGNSSLKMLIKNGNTRTELNIVMVENVNIYDAKTKTTNVLMNVMGKKYFIRQKAEDVKGENEQQLKKSIAYTEETKTIAGYVCKKAVVKNADEAAVVWFTEDIPNSVNADKSMQGLQQLKGMPMEFEIKQPEQGFTMKMIAANVVKEPIDDAKFVVPTDYKETTQEALMEILQKNIPEK